MQATSHPAARAGRAPRALAWLACAVLLALVASAAAADDAPIRTVVPLDGTWQFALEEELLAAGMHAHGDEIATFPWLESVHRALEVPGCFTTQLPDMRTWVGAGWYRRKLPVDALPAGTQVIGIRFEGVARRAEVYVNGWHLATHEFSYTPFEVEVPADLAVRDGGSLLLAVRVSNEIPERGIPDRAWEGWWNHAGIFREVTMIGYADATRLAAPVTRTYLRDRAAGPAGGWQYHVVPRVRRHPAEPPRALSEDVDVQATLVEGGGGARTWTLEGPPPGTDGFLFDLPGDVAGWSPDAPARHTLRLDLRRDGAAIDRVEFRIGLRDLRRDGSTVLLNGAPLRLLGMSYHEVRPDTGYTQTHAQMRADLEDMKSLGANFLRTSHYPAHPHVLDLCDELGLAVWEEIPAWKTTEASLTDDTVFREWAAPYLTEMIERDRWRPSVLFWSVGNEFDSREPGVRAYIERAIAHVKTLDRSRFATFASDKRLDDIALDLVDVIGINEYYGWYYGDPEDLGPVLDQLIARHPNVPLLVTEFGAETILGLAEKVPGARRDYSEPHQLWFIESHLRQIFDPARAAHLLGAAMWLYNDFDDPHRTERRHPIEWHGVNMKGLVTRAREPKAAYFRFRELAREFGFLPRDAEGAAEVESAAAEPVAMEAGG